MKKIFIILTLICMFLFCFNNADCATAPNGKTAPTASYSDVKTYNASYYSSVEGKTGDALLEGLASLSKTKHRYFTTYDEIWGATCYSDADPNNSSSKIIDFYTQKSISNAYNTSVWNREHVWCQSLTNGLYGTTGAGADIHHIRPSIDNINSSRNNSLYGEVSSSKPKYYSFTNDKVSTSSSDTLYGYLDSSLSPSGTFEPLDGVKGDVARIVMYVYMHYSKEVSANSSFSYAGNMYITNIVYTSQGTAQAAWNLLMDWNESDPVDSFEKNRNNYCASVTGVRNPFIDHPEFADMIWSTSYSGGGALGDDSGSSGTTPNIDYSSLLNEYYNSGVYTKKTNIYLNCDSTNEISQYFHGDVVKDRTTYYNGEYLLMGDIDGGFSTINSGYRTSGSDVKHFTYQNGSVVDDYTISGTTLHSLYVTMTKMKSNYLDSSWNDGTHEVTSNSDKYLNDFLAFTAPCLTDYVLSSNYLTTNGIKLEIAEETNNIGKHLALRIYASAVDSGKVGTDLLLSEARIYKGNTKFNDTNLNSTPVVPDDSGSGDNSGGSSGGSSSGGSTTTAVKATYSYTFTSKVFTSESTKALGDYNWRASGTDGATFSSYNSTKGQQFGTAAKPFYAFNLTATTDFANITSIYITTSGANGTQAKLKIYVGDTVYGERTLTSTSTTYRVTPGGVTGRVSFKYTQSTVSGVAKAIYIKEIKVYYTKYVTTYTSDGSIETSNYDNVINLFNETIDENNHAMNLFNMYSNNTSSFKSYI